ncbi:hypothetical protein MPF19_18445 [Polaribacter sp. Z014]|nr:hypothetical protein [Polaribacter sp. Z014]
MKIERLTSLESKIELYSDREHFFDSIEELLINEIQNEKDGDNRKIYVDLLESIEGYELEEYKSHLKERPKKGFIEYYLSLTNNFKSVVSGEITHLELTK